VRGSKEGKKKVFRKKRDLPWGETPDRGKKRPKIRQDGLDLPSS